jgi:hypothetical protein
LTRQWCSEGWGLTETTAAVTLNLPAAQRIGTVGRPLPGCQVRLADDGEVLVRGGVVFPGYRHNDTATDNAFEAGWLRTGDTGTLDTDGYLSITGGKKDIIVTAGGKNVAPAYLEDQLRRHRLIDQCVLVGDRPAVHRRAGHHGPGRVRPLAANPRQATGHDRGPAPRRPGTADGRAPRRRHGVGDQAGGPGGGAGGDAVVDDHSGATVKWDAGPATAQESRPPVHLHPCVCLGGGQLPRMDPRASRARGTSNTTGHAAAAQGKHDHVRAAQTRQRLGEAPSVTRSLNAIPDFPRLYERRQNVSSAVGFRPSGGITRTGR